MRVTFFPDFAARSKTARDLDLSQIADLARTTTAASKSELPWLKCASFADAATRSGSLRNNGNVIAVTGVEGDYDGELIGPDEAADMLRAAGVEALIYTSPSHTPALPRWRVLCPLSEPMPAGMRAEMLGRVNHILGGVLATESFTLSQAFYIGSVAGGAPVETHIVIGRPVDALELPVLYPVSKRAEPIDLPPAAPGLAGDARAAQALAAALNAFTELRQDRHSTILAATILLAPFVKSGHLDGQDVVSRIHDACTESGREPNPGEVASALSGCLSKVMPYVPAGAEFDALPPLPSARSALLGRMLHPADCATGATRGYLIKHLLAPGDVAALIGPPSSGKSVLAPHVAYAVAQGRPVFGLRTKPGRVLYAAAEDAAGMGQRVRALYEKHGDAPAFGLLPIGNLRDATAAAEFKAAVVEWHPALLVIDTLGAAWAGLDENSSVDMGSVVALAREIAAAGCACLIVHHVAKHGDGSPRGHSVLNGTLDMCLAIDERGPDGVIRAKLQKNRNGTPDREIAFRISVADLGADEDGDAITAPIASEVTSGAASAPKLNRQQGIAWTEFLRIEAETAPDASGTRAVSLTTWKDACELAALSASSNRDSQRTAFNRAAGDLYRLKFIMKSAACAWRPAHGVRYETNETDRDGIETVSGQDRDGRDGGSREPRPVSVPGSEFFH